MNNQLASFFMGDYIVIKTNHKTSRLDFMVLTIDKSYVCGVKRTRHGYWWVYYSGWYRCNNKNLWLKDKPKTYYNFCGPKISEETAKEILAGVRSVVE